MSKKSTKTKRKAPKKNQTTRKIKKTTNRKKLIAPLPASGNQNENEKRACKNSK